MSGYAVSKKPKYPEKGQQIPVLRNKVVPANRARIKKVEPQSNKKLVAKQNNLHNLPALNKAPSDSKGSFGSLLAQAHPQSYSPQYYQKTLDELKLGLKVICGFLVLVYLGWAAAVKVNATDGGGLIYNTGLIGGSLMLFALIYSVTKRSKFLHRYLNSELWYYMHVFGGAIGAYLVLVHSSFDLRSINASIGLVTTMIIITSGALGRYLYTLSTISLHKQLVAVNISEQELYNLTVKYEDERALQMRLRLALYTLYCFRKPQSRFNYLIRWVTTPCFGLYYYMSAKTELNFIAKNISTVTNFTKKDIRILKKYQERKLQQYIMLTLKMGYTNLAEQLLRHWRIFHIPALYLLTITAIVHVIGVHMY